MKKGKVLIVFHDMTRDMDSSKKINLVVTEIFLRGRKLLVNMLVVFTSQSYFKVR